MPGMEGVEGHGSPFWGGKGGYIATHGHMTLDCIQVLPSFDRRLPCSRGSEVCGA